MWWSWLRTWWRGHPASLLHWHVVMYTRRGCHLCEQAWELLEQARGRYGFTLEEVDVDTDPELAARYGREVPVVMVNGAWHECLKPEDAAKLVDDLKTRGEAALSGCHHVVEK